MRPGTLMLAALPPLALYVHLPWCLKKCPYCDFNSHEWRDGGTPPEARYLAALRADLEAALPFIWGRRVLSVFIGGGTPSLFSPDAIATLIGDIRARLPLEPGAEITLEANPGTFERDRFRAFREAGVTRLSIGVQSFDDARLHALGRVHDAAQARTAVEEAARHFETFNLDLMYALPGQTVAELGRELDEALAFAPPHLSVYHLTIEPNTLFAKRPPAGLPDDDQASDMLDCITERTLADAAPARARHANYVHVALLLGLDAPRDTLFGQLSPADQTRAAVALASIRPSRLIVVDDLDRETTLADQAALWAGLLDLAAEGVTVVASTSERAAVPPEVLTREMDPRHG